MVDNLLYNAEDVGLIPHAAGQLSLHTTTTELTRLNKKACVPQTTEPTCSGTHAPQLEKRQTHMPQLERSPHAATKKIPHASKKIPRATTKTRRSQK